MSKPLRPAVDTPEAARWLVDHLADIFTSPDLIPVVVDPEGGTLGFVPAHWEDHDSLPFHTAPTLREVTPEAMQLPLSYLLGRYAQTKPASDPLHFILHHAFCGSTLLSRALASITPTLAHREPEALHGALKAVAGSRRDPVRRPEALQILRLVLHLLARHRPGDVATVVKASDSATLGLGETFAARPESRGVFLYTSPETFVALALKSDTRREWLGRRATWYERGRLPLAPGAEMPRPDSPPGRIALSLWMSHAAAVRRLARDLGETRLRTLSTEVLVRDVGAAATAAGRFFGLEVAPHAASLLEPLLGRHAKLGHDYGPSERDAELAELQRRHARDIEDALGWARATAGDSALASTLPFPLLR